MPEFMNQSRIDSFFKELSSVFIYSLNNGLARISECPFKVENEFILSTANSGFRYIEKGYNPCAIKTILEANNLFLIASYPEAKNVVFELKLLEILIPNLQDHEIHEFLKWAEQFCSMPLASFLRVQFSKYTDAPTPDQ